MRRPATVGASFYNYEIQFTYFTAKRIIDICSLQSYPERSHSRT